MPSRRFFPAVIAGGVLLLPWLGAYLGAVLYGCTENTVMEEIRIQQHALGEAVHGLVERELTVTSNLLASAANLPGLCEAQETGVNDGLLVLEPLVPDWVDRVCVEHGDGEPTQCVGSGTGRVRENTGVPGESAAGSGVAVLVAADGSTRVVLRHPLAGPAADGPGSLVATARLPALFHSVLQTVHLQGETDLELYGDDGTLLHHPNPSYVGRTWEEIEAKEQPLHDWPAGAEAAEASARSLFLSSSHGSVTYPNQNVGSREVLAHYGPIDGLPRVHMVLARRMDGVLAKLERERHWAALIGAAASAPLLLTLVLGWARVRERRRRAEPSLSEAQRAKDELRTVLDSVTTWIFTTNEEGIITRANRHMRQELLELGEADPVGRLCPEVFEVTDPVVCAQRHGAQVRNPDYFELTWRGRTLLMTVRPVPLSDGAVETLHTAEDVTESRQLQRAVERSDRLSSVGLLAGSIGHEINNVLASLNGYAEMLCLRADDGDFCRKAGEVFSAQLDRVHLLARNLLSLGRFPEPRKEPADVVALFRKLIEMLTTSGLIRRFEVQAEWQPVPTLVCDPGQIEQALTNLIVNAGQAMGEVGILSLATSTENGEVVLSVGDTGPGLTPEDRERVFEPLFTTKGKKGTGLGLFVTRKIAEVHGGRVVVDSEPGKGATFSLRLPFPEG